MKSICRLVALLALALAFSACSSAATGNSTPAPVSTPDLNRVASDYPKVDGSTSTLPLHTLVACQILNVPCAWYKPLFAERTIGPDPKAAIGGQRERVRAVTRHNGTHAAYLNLTAGKADLILVARVPSEDELKAAREKGVELEVIPFALDAFVFLVNVQNSVNDLALENVRDIYAGGITDWAALGGKGAIKAYQRDRNSGSQELMDALVMRGTPMIKAPDMIIETMMGAVNAVGQQPLGIGYSVYYYATFMLPDEKVKLVGINGVHPTSDTITERTYPLTAEVYAVMRSGMARQSTAAILRDWLLTDDGQAAVAASGYVPLRTVNK